MSFPTNWLTGGWLTLQDWDAARELGAKQVVGAMRMEAPEDAEDVVPSNLAEGHLLGGLYWPELDDKRDGLDTWWLTSPPVEYFEPPAASSDGEDPAPGGATDRPTTGGEPAGPARPVTGGGASYGGSAPTSSGSGSSSTSGSAGGGETRTRPVTTGDGGATRARLSDDINLGGGGGGPGPGSGWFALAARGERDERLAPKSPAFPTWVSDMRLPSGWVGTILSGTKSLERAPQEEFLLPGFYGLVAPNRNPDYEMGTPVHELGPDKRPAFHSWLQSLVSVEQVGSARSNALAIQLGPEALRGSAGYMMLSDWGRGTLASASNYQGGPLLTGEEKDQHKVGTTRDGKTINAAHCSTFTLWHGAGWDCPLFFEGGPWPKPDVGPHKILTHLVNDISASHAWGTPASGRTGAGLGRWYTDAFWYGDDDDPWSPPPKPPPGGDPPPPPPPPPPPGGSGSGGSGSGPSITVGGGGHGTIVTAGEDGAGADGDTSPVDPPPFPPFPPVPEGSYTPTFGPPSAKTFGPWPGGGAGGVPLPEDALSDDSGDDEGPTRFPWGAPGSSGGGWRGDGWRDDDSGDEEGPPGFPWGAPGSVPSPEGTAYSVPDWSVRVALVGDEPTRRATYSTSTNCITAAGGVAFRVAATAVGQVDLKGAKVVRRADRQASDRAPIAAVLEAYGIGDGTWGGWESNDDGSLSDPHRRQNVNGAIALLPAWAGGVGPVLAGGLGIGSLIGAAAGYTRASLTFPTDYSQIALGTPSEENGSVKEGTLLRATSDGLQLQPVDGNGNDTPGNYSFTPTLFLVDGGAGLRVTTGDAYIGGKMTVVGRLDPSSVEPSDLGGAANPIPTGGPSGSQGITFDSTADALRPRWQDPAGTETSLALLSDVGGGAAAAVEVLSTQFGLLTTGTFAVSAGKLAANGDAVTFAGGGIDAGATSTTFAFAGVTLNTVAAGIKVVQYSVTILRKTATTAEYHGSVMDSTGGVTAFAGAYSVTWASVNNVVIGANNTIGGVLTYVPDA